ncbi:hypothetical protein [Gluconacetobacter entanii]|uniref:Uncharacterized protein n=1 Tax=Gluconacetobacter entanii TaxID=108528 RepID=A0A318PSM1_9PROT|nr:hypothetical protein [Gluconacetobacter entanii]PYD63561.1 hypothetical protein CFR72_06550 [Gluconacetobacter entanii]
MTTSPQTAASPAAATPTAAQTTTKPDAAYVVMMPGYGYPLGTQITNAATIAKLKANGTLGRFTVRVALKQEK